MSRFEEFIQSLRVGRTSTEREQLERDELCRTLPQTLARVFQRLCDNFQCPNEQAHYLDLQANSVAGAVRNSAPPVGLNLATGRRCLGLEICVDEQPIWLYFECVPLKHDGLELHFRGDLFQFPAEETKFFDQVAGAINQELRSGHAPAARKIGF